MVSSCSACHGHGEQFFPHAAHAAESQHGVSELAAAHVDHDSLDVAEAVFLHIDDVLDQQGIGAHLRGPRAGLAACALFVHSVLVPV
jgi:hypothetical protein